VDTTSGAAQPPAINMISSKIGIIFAIMNLQIGEN